VILARTSTRSQFVAGCPFPFLVSKSSLVARPSRPRTAGVLDGDVLLAMDEQVRVARSKTSVMALPIRKATDAPGDKITVGRTLSADVIIEHATVSEIHAAFLREEGGFHLADAGSRNGTWVSGRLLAPDGSPSPVIESGESVRFGELI
jgi:pSer/pThr/pTyr-binding forkhead associated (FHA) protein